MIYSHSRISTFEQCPYKFKLRYIDKVQPEEADTIETFLGVRVHETLEKLYRDQLEKKENTLEDLICYLRTQWEDNYRDSIIIVKNHYSVEQYRSMAERYIQDYYRTYYPFQQDKTLSVEHHFLISLDETEGYKVQGYIDRLAERKPGYYEIHDYKTNNRLPPPKYIQSNRQLALYALGAKDQYPNAKDIRLIWHFLAFNKKIESTRTNEQLTQLKKDLIHLIDIIEQEENYLTRPSMLCNWCEFKQICHQWSPLFKTKEKPEIKQLKTVEKDLVDRYVTLKQGTRQQRLDLYAELEELEIEMIAYAEKKNAKTLIGSNHTVKITTHNHYVTPKKESDEWILLLEKIKEITNNEEITDLDITFLNKFITDRKWKKRDIDKNLPMIKKVKTKRISL